MATAHEQSQRLQEVERALEALSMSGEDSLLRRDLFQGKSRVWHANVLKTLEDKGLVRRGGTSSKPTYRCVNKRGVEKILRSDEAIAAIAFPGAIPEEVPPKPEPAPPVAAPAKAQAPAPKAPVVEPPKEPEAPKADLQADWGNQVREYVNLMLRNGIRFEIGDGGRLKTRSMHADPMTGPVRKRIEEMTPYILDVLHNRPPQLPPEKSAAAALVNHTAVPPQAPPMSPDDVIAAVRAKGGQFHIKNGDVIVRGVSLTNGLIDGLRTMKSGIMQALLKESASKNGSSKKPAPPKPVAPPAVEVKPAVTAPAPPPPPPPAAPPMPEIDVDDLSPVEILMLRNLAAMREALGRMQQDMAGLRVEMDQKFAELKKLWS